MDSGSAMDSGVAVGAWVGAAVGGAVGAGVGVGRWRRGRGRRRRRRSGSAERSGSVSVRGVGCSRSLGRRRVGSGVGAAGSSVTTADGGTAVGSADWRGGSDGSEGKAKEPEGTGMPLQATKQQRQRPATAPSQRQRFAAAVLQFAVTCPSRQDTVTRRRIGPIPVRPSAGSVGGLAPVLDLPGVVEGVPRDPVGGVAGRPSLAGERRAVGRLRRTSSISARRSSSGARSRRRELLALDAHHLGVALLRAEDVVDDLRCVAAAAPRPLPELLGRLRRDRRRRSSTPPRRGRPAACRRPRSSAVDPGA